MEPNSINFCESLKDKDDNNRCSYLAFIKL